MKRLIMALAILTPAISLAGSCPLSQVKQKVVRAAYLIEALNGSTSRLTTELHSYSSKMNTWAVIFSYSGVQNIWTVETTNDGCWIKSLSK